MSACQGLRSRWDVEGIGKWQDITIEEKVGKEHMRSLCLICYNYIYTYRYLKFKC